MKDHKDFLMELIEEYRVFDNSRKRAHSKAEDDNDSQKKKYKYSKEESELIMKSVHEFMEVHNLTAQDLCPALRETDQDNLDIRVKRKPCELWVQLHQQLPHSY